MFLGSAGGAGNGGHRLLLHQKAYLTAARANRSQRRKGGLWWPNHDRSLVPVPSYLRDLYQLITLLLSDRRVAGIADFRALSEVNHEAEVNRLLIWIATATRQFLDMDGTWHRQIHGQRSVRTILEHVYPATPTGTTEKLCDFDKHATSSFMRWRSRHTILIVAIIEA